MADCAVHSGTPEQVLTESTVLDCCLTCTALLTGNSVESVAAEQAALELAEQPYMTGESN